MLINLKTIMKFVTFFLIISLVTINFQDKTKLENINSNIHGEIKFFSQRVDKKDEIEELIKEFEIQYPNVKVNVELIGEVGNYLKRKASVGELPDVTMVSENIVKSRYNDYLLPIDELGFTKDNLYAYQDGEGLDGKLYALATGISFICVIYNKYIFYKAGINVIPKSDAEFLEACKKIKAVGKIPFAVGYKEPWILEKWINSIPYLRQPDFEKKVIDETGLLGEKSELYEDLKLLKTIVNNGYCEDNFKDYEWNKCKSDFIDGKIGMIILSCDFINQFTDGGMNRDSIGIFPIPGRKEIIMENDFMIGVAKTSKYPEAAKKLLQFLFENDRYTNVINVTSALKESPKTKKLMRELEGFGIPIEFLTEANSNNIVRVNEFFSRKVSSGLGYEFIQHYLTANDEDAVIKEMEGLWNENK